MLAAGESDQMQMPIQHSEGPKALFAIGKPRVFQNGHLLPIHARDIFEIEAVLGEVRPTLGRIPFEVHD